jgi:hypothetical protein
MACAILAFVVFTALFTALADHTTSLPRLLMPPSPPRLLTPPLVSRLLTSPLASMPPLPPLYSLLFSPPSPTHFRQGWDLCLHRKKHYHDK